MSASFRIVKINRHIFDGSCLNESEHSTHKKWRRPSLIRSTL